MKNSVVDLALDESEVVSDGCVVPVMPGSSNKNLHKAKSSKKDEFYTQLSDIEKELRHYKEHFKDKVVLCNCDDSLLTICLENVTVNCQMLCRGCNRRKSCK